MFVTTKEKEMFPNFVTDREQMEFLESQWYKGKKLA